MTSKVAVDLGPVQETLLIPLLGRAEETKKQHGLIRDPKAVEIVQSLDYDFAKWQGIPSLQGATVRARMFDQEVREFLAQHPRGTVVEIGAGLNTRYERLDNGQAHWLELDLPDSMALRRRFFEDTDRRTMVAASALDEGWHARVKALPGPYCFVSEAVLIYLDNADVERCLRSLGEAFPGATLILDTTSSELVDGQHKHDAMRTMSKDSWFRFRCDDPNTLRDWGLALDSSRTFLDAPDDVVADMPIHYRFFVRYMPFLLRRKVSGYRINRLHFNGSEA